MASIKQPVGAHYGWKDWLIQRITAVIMVLFSVLILGFFLVHGGAQYADWKRLFSSSLVRILSFLFFLSVFYHAWIGIRDVLMDYIKPVGLRLTLQVSVVCFLLACAIWAGAILWGGV